MLGAAYADSGVLGVLGKRPGNLTGFVYGLENFDVKRLEMLRERQILGGKKPSDLPIQQQASQEMVLNRAAIRELGLEVPPGLVIRASRVIGQ